MTFQNKLANSVHLSLVGAPKREAKLESGNVSHLGKEAGLQVGMMKPTHAERKTQKNSERYSNPGLELFDKLS